MALDKTAADRLWLEYQREAVECKSSFLERRALRAVSSTISLPLSTAALYLRPSHLMLFFRQQVCLPEFSGICAIADPRTVKGALLAQHFAVNSGAEYKYNVATASIPFDKSPSCVMEALTL